MTLEFLLFKRLVDVRTSLRFIKFRLILKLSSKKKRRGLYRFTDCFLFQIPFFVFFLFRNNQGSDNISKIYKVKYHTQKIY